MAKPYSYDLRQKVIEAIELNGTKKSEASEHLNISRNTAACFSGEASPEKLPYQLVVPT